MLPLPFKERLRILFKDKASLIEKGIESKKENYTFRLNTQKMSLEELKICILDESLTKIPFIENAFTTKHKELYTKNPLFFAGCVYFQDLSSMVPVQILGVEEDSKVLDACASPGSKSTQIISHLGLNGLLIANEITRTRVSRLIDNIATWGTTQVIVSSQQTAILGYLKGFFDKVLIDAPCSGEGMFAKNKDAIDAWSVKLVKKCSSLQREILTNILPSLKKGGELVYSTCTMAPEENEGIIDWLLATYKDFVEIVPVGETFSLGEEGMTEFEGKTYLPSISKNTRRIFPYHSEFLGEAFFVAKIKILKEIPLEQNDRHGKNKELRYKNYQEVPHKLVAQFLEDLSLTKQINPKDTMLLGHYLYYKKDISESVLKNLIPLLHPVYCGVRLGVLKKDRIEPQKELMTSFSDYFYEEKNNVINLNLEDCVNYMLLKEIPLNGEYKNGFVGVAFLNHPLGVGKISQNNLKSYYNMSDGKKLL